MGCGGDARTFEEFHVVQFEYSNLLPVLIYLLYFPSPSAIFSQVIFIVGCSRVIMPVKEAARRVAPDVSFPPEFQSSLYH